MSLSIIKSEAKKIRHTLEIYSINSRFYGYGIHLAGACAVASVQLRNILKKHRIKSNTYVGTFGKYYPDVRLYKKMMKKHKSDFAPMLATYQHCWLETDHYLIDITFTQFKSKFKIKTPKILILDKKTPKYKEFLAYWIKFNKITNFKDWDDFEHPKYWKKIIKKNRDLAQ